MYSGPKVPYHALTGISRRGNKYTTALKPHLPRQFYIVLSVNYQYYADSQSDSHHKEETVQQYNTKQLQHPRVTLIVLN